MCAAAYSRPAPDRPPTSFDARPIMTRRDLTATALVLFLSFATAATASDAGARPRARDLGIPFDGTPGALNAITDVDGVLVGQTTLIEGNGMLVVGTGPVRTGVTA